MLITELLDKKIEMKVKTDNPRTFHVSAKINGREIMFQSARASRIEGKNAWDVMFSEIKTLSNGASYGNYKMTGNGGELEVFAFVKDCMLALVKKHDPDEIHFSANKDGGKKLNARGDVYERLIKRFKLPGYELDRETKTQKIDNGKFKASSHRPYDYFVLRKQ